MTKKIVWALVIVICLVFVLWFLGFNLSGCGASNNTSSSSTAAVMKGQVQNAASASSAQALAWPPGQIPGNSNYDIIVATPSAYSVGIWRTRFFKGLSDTTPYTMATWATVGQTPGHFDLTSTASQWATNANYPAAGTYTHMIPTLAYLQQTLPASLVDYFGITKFRVITANYDSYQRGDLLVYVDNAWQWIDTSASTWSATRPTNLKQVNWGSDGTTEVNGITVFEPQDVSMESFVIPSNPSGTYTFTLLFDIASCFAFNDLNGNGVFEPGAEYPNGDVATTSMQQSSGEAEWSVGPPSLSITVTN